MPRMSDETPLDRLRRMDRDDTWSTSDLLWWQKEGLRWVIASLDDAMATRTAALALSRAVEPADLPPAARVELLRLRARLAATGVDPVGDG